MSTTERMQIIYENYEQPQIDQILRSVTTDAVTVISHELSTLRGKQDKNPEDFSKEKSVELVLAMVDELADRIKAEVRYRISEIDKLEKAEEEVEKQL